tara:strand:- start:126 stop:959 length:834 start_codon:yes stop_codon:yes gene_type:complete
MTQKTKKNRHSYDELKALARNIRRSVIKMVAQNGKGYVQQGLGAADLFCYLFGSVLKYDKNDQSWPGRDRFLLSTAHNSAVFHATLAEFEIIPKVSLSSYCKDSSKLEINVSERLGTIVECTCGSLGQGLSVAIGIAQSAKRQNLAFRTYVLLGDGELQEGQTWEAAMYAGSNKVDNLCLIIDVNQLQVEGDTKDVLNMEPISEKWSTFGWAVRTVNGHDFEELEDAFNWAIKQKDKPSVILAKTIVGKGVNFLEGQKSHNMIFPKEIANLSLKALS